MHERNKILEHKYTEDLAILEAKAETLQEELALCRENLQSPAPSGTGGTLFDEIQQQWDTRSMQSPTKIDLSKQLVDPIFKY